MGITRYNGAGEAVIANGGNVSDEIYLKGAAGGSFFIPGDWDGGSSVSFHMGDKPGGTFGPFKDTTNALVSQPVTPGAWYAFPAGLVQGQVCKIVAAGSVGATRSILWTAKG